MPQPAMRFGENFHNYFITEWEEHYVDYHRLKRLVKSLSGVKFDPSVDAEIFTSLSAAIASLVKFFQADRANLDFPAPFAGVFAFADPGNLVNPFGHIGRGELVGILDICARKRHDLRQLDWFQKVNSDAIDRIFAKVDRFISATSNHHPAYGRVALQWDDARHKIHRHLDKAGAAITAMEAEARNSPNWAVDGTVRSSVPFKNRLAALLISAGMAKETERQVVTAKVVLSYLKSDLGSDRVKQLSWKCDWGDRWALVSAARYGLQDICAVIVSILTSQQYFKDYSDYPTTTSQRIQVFDMVLTALQVSVSQNHTSTAQYLLGVVRGTEFGGRLDWLIDTHWENA